MCRRIKRRLWAHLRALQTGIHIVNTSDSTQVVKFRFRRATDGINALDFNIVMSPRDVYAGFLSDDENGTISWSSSDTTCRAPAT